MALGEQIKYFRNKKNLTQSELADLMGLKPVTIGKYESNEREPNLENLKKLSTVLEVPLIKLVEGEKFNQVPLKGILSVTTENSSIEQQVVADLIRQSLNGASAKFEELLTNFLMLDSVQKELNYNAHDLTGGDLVELRRFLMSMLKLKLLEINSNKKE